MAAANIEQLCRRLAETPVAYFRPLEAKRDNSIDVEAIVCDLFRDRTSRLPSVSQLEALRLPSARQRKERKAARRHVRTVLLTSWLMHDEAFENLDFDKLLGLLLGKLRQLSTLVTPRSFVSDSSRREELVRVCLMELGITPHGESSQDAEDRLSTLDSVRRNTLLNQARERERERERKRKELEKLRKQEEEERRKAARTGFED